MNSSWCASPYRYARRATREVRIGDVGVGGRNPIRIQSMTTPATTDTAATVAQICRLVEAGCEIVRLTVPTSADARNLPVIRKELAARRIKVPLVADIHFSPGAALKAVEHVEKIRVNPGNYADRKQFSVREYSDAEYDSELARLEETFRPLVERARELGVAMRIGTNHGSLSDRILNRYGDSPLGMVESALEFVRICEAHGYRDLVISMKSSNPVVTIEAYRLLAARMAAERMAYPFHLGVTEAGDGEDGRVKSAIGIGSLLADGIGDTIRVSLTEDPALEIPVAQRLVEPFNRWTAEACRPRDLAGGPFALATGPTESVLKADASGLAFRNDATGITLTADLTERARTTDPPGLTPDPTEAAFNTDATGLEFTSDATARTLPFDPFSYARRQSRIARFGPCAIGGEAPVRVEVRLVAPLDDAAGIRREIDAQAGPRVPLETRADLVEARVDSKEDWDRFRALRETIERVAPHLAISARLGPAMVYACIADVCREGAPVYGRADHDSTAGAPGVAVPGGSWTADRIVLPADSLLSAVRQGLVDLSQLPRLAGAPILLEGSARSLLTLLDAAGLGFNGASHTREADSERTERRSGGTERGAERPSREVTPDRSATVPALPTRPQRGIAHEGSLALSIPCMLDDLEAPAARPGGDPLSPPFPGEPMKTRTGHEPAAVLAVHEYRRLAAGLRHRSLDIPIVLACAAPRAETSERHPAAILDLSLALGSLLCDGIGDAVSVTAGDATASRALAFTILQGARVRISRTEFISCPSCGRTLFDLEETTRRIKLRTAHLKGLKIAIMGCVVNGPGEMADADFGYVGWGTDKIALFVGKELVARDIPLEEADDRLVALIQEHGKWQDPPVLGADREVPVNLDL